MNIPIYRAKKLDSDEYIIGDLFDGKYIIAKSELNRDISEALKHIREDILIKDCISAECKNEHHLLNKMLNKLLVNERLEHIYEIDPTTLSIHFPDMIDSQGNKIFASLQEYGKGGDILQSRGYKAPCVFNKGFTVKTVVGVCNFYMLADRLKVVGIQE